MIDLGGTIRENNAIETLARLRPILGTFGITRVFSIDVLAEVEIPVVMALRPNSKNLASGQGKGVTRALAEVSAIMETIECHHSENIRGPDCIATIQELRASNTPFVHPSFLQLTNLESLLSETDSIRWITVKNIETGAPILVPWVYLCLSRASEVQSASELAIFGTSNGLASGNSKEEAISHALFELIERQCHLDFFVLSDDEKESRRLELDSISNAPHVKDLLSRIQSANLDLEIHAIHNRLEVPAFKALIQGGNDASSTSGTAAGYGAHYLPEIALSRAITEAIQSRTIMISGSRDDLYPWTYTHAHPAYRGFLRDISTIVNGKGAFDWKMVPKAPIFTSFKEIIGWTLNRIKAQGFGETFVFDHQRADFGNIPVVHVITPGLRFDYERMHGEKE